MGDRTPSAGLSRLGSAISRTHSIRTNEHEGPEEGADAGGLQTTAGKGGGGGGRVARQLLYSELLSRPGGPWAWMEVGNSREKALPKIFNLTVLNLLDVYSVSRMERTSRLWREFLQTPDGVAVWQRVVHEVAGKVQIDSYKIALGLRAGQSYEQERLDLQSRNWRRIMRMHRANTRFPYYRTDHKVTLLANHAGPVLCMVIGGPYLFSGGADGKLLMYRIPLFLTFTPEREREFKQPPAPSRYFGQPKTKNGLNIAHDGPILSVAAGKDFVLSAGVDGEIRLWRMESAPGR